MQGLVCFAIWLAYGLVQSRRSEFIRAKVEGMSRSARVRSGAASMILGATLLFAAFFGCIYAGGFTAQGLAIWAWFVLAGCGLAFVHAQTMSMALLVSLVQDSVTSMPPASSDQQTPNTSQ